MYMLGIDIGTSCAKCLAITRDGQVAARVSREYPLLTPRPGWAEQDPAWWIRAAYESIRQLLAVSGILPDEIEGIGAGWYRTAEEAVGVLKTEREIRPDITHRAAYEKAFQLYSRIYPALKDVFHS